MSSWENNEEIKLFQEFLRIPSVHPDPDYDECVNFLTRQAEDLGLPIKCYYPAHPKKPVVVMTWTGTEPELPSIVLNSHMDVVPVYPESWTHPPFAAEIDADGKIFARGSQDMKCVGMQYLAAIRALKKDGLTFRRTIHIMFVPDEEIGGQFGMKSFVPTEDFKSLNVGFLMDEGGPFPMNLYFVFYGERTHWEIEFTMTGTTGHGSLMHKNTAGEKMRYIVNKMMDMRDDEMKKYDENAQKTLISYDNVTSINLTMISGGVQSNVVPATLKVRFDLRIDVNVDLEELEQKFRKWCEDCEGVEMTFLDKAPYVPPTILDDNSPFWFAFKAATSELGMEYQTRIFPATTDSNTVRRYGYPAIGFSPMPNTPILAHSHDEFLQADIYLQGIETYKTILTHMGQV